MMFPNALASQDRCDRNVCRSSTEAVTLLVTECEKCLYKDEAADKITLPFSIFSSWKYVINNSSIFRFC